MKLSVILYVFEKMRKGEDLIVFNVQLLRNYKVGWVSVNSFCWGGIEFFFNSEVINVIINMLIWKFTLDHSSNLIELSKQRDKALAKRRNEKTTDIWGIYASMQKPIIIKIDTLIHYFTKQFWNQFNIFSFK